MIVLGSSSYRYEDVCIKLIGGNSKSKSNSLKPRPGQNYDRLPEKYGELVPPQSDALTKQLKLHIH